MTGATVVLGGGVAATACALFAARHGPVVLHGRPPAVGVRVVESVPAATLTLLLELGILPVDLDVAGLQRQRRVAWEATAPERHDGPACAHLDRAALLAALWHRVRRHPRISLAAPDAPRPTGALVDATGRRAGTAVDVLRPPMAWVAAVSSRPRGPADPVLRLAAAPDGYAYRLGSARLLTVGWVGVGRPPRDMAALWRRVEQADAGWLLDGLPAPSGEPTRRCPAAAALPVPGRDAVPIGDAALTRDALASQGTSIALSDACLAADPAVTAAQLAARRTDARDRHLRHLAGMLGRCHAADSPAWSGYRDWVDMIAVQRPDQCVARIARSSADAASGGSGRKAPSAGIVRSARNDGSDSSRNASSPS